jgi:MFS family permease
MDNRSTRIRLTNTIFVSQSLITASQVSILTLLAIMATELSGNESFAGLPQTALTLSRSLMAIPMGIIMGRLGRRFGLSVSYGVSVVGAAVGVLAIMGGSFLLIMVSSTLIGLGRAGGEQSRFAAGDMFPEGERGRIIGRVVFAGTIGAVVGPLLINPGTWLAGQFGIDNNSGPWLIATILYTVATLNMLILLYPEPNTLADDKPKRKPKTDEVDPSVRTTWELLKLPSVRLAVLSMLISQMVMVALMVITPLHMVHHAHGNQEVGWVISFHTFGMFALSSVTGRLIDTYGPVRVMLFGGLTLFASAVIAPLSAALPVLLLALFLLGVGWNLGFIAGSTLLSDSLRGVERTRMQGVGDMMVGGAAALGSASSGPIYHMGGYVAVAALVVIFSLLFLYIHRLLGVQAAAVRKPKPQTAV